jgi:uncharacterized protein
MKRLIGTLLVMLWPMMAAAQSYPDYTSSTVNDLAGLLSDADEATLTAQLTALKNETGVEMTVLTISRQNAYQPDMSFEAFATGLFNHWGIGDRTLNNGILVLVARTDRVMRIELGRGYGSAWDQTAQRVVDYSFLPRFKEDNYRIGILDGVTDTIDAIARPAAAGTTPTKDERTKDESPVWPFFALALAGGIFAFWSKIKDASARVQTCPSCGRRGGLRVLRRTTHAASTTLAGSGERLSTCEHCDYRAATIYPIAQLGTSTSSGGSSFGGGGSSGGGASGRW